VFIFLTAPHTHTFIPQLNAGNNNRMLSSLQKVDSVPIFFAYRTCQFSLGFSLFFTTLKFSVDGANQSLAMSVSFSDFSLLLQCSSVVCEASHLAL
jgi:hypothetical protein